MEIPQGYFVRRCSHIKSNGIPCGSPALVDDPLCYFHHCWAQTQADLQNNPIPDLPLLEDANSIQLAITQVTQLLIRGRLDPKIAGLLLYALQTASGNVRRMTLEAAEPQHVVVDPAAALHACIGDYAWQLHEFPASQPLSADAPATGAGNAVRRPPAPPPSTTENSLVNYLLEKLGFPNNHPERPALLYENDPDTPAAAYLERKPNERKPNASAQAADG